MTQTVLLGSVASLKYGKMPDKNRVSTNGPYPIYSGYRITGYYDEYNCDEKLIVVARGVGGTGDVKISPARSYLTNLSIMVELDESVINKRYLYYQLTNGLRHLNTGSAQPQITTSDLKGLKILLPSLDQQEKIADILGTIDEKIELNRKMNETLEHIGRSLFCRYFIDNPEAKKWKEKSLDEIADFLNGLAMQKYPKVDSKPTLPVIKIREMSSGITANTDIASADIPERYIVHNGDLLFSWSGTLLVKFWAEGEGALNQHLFKVTSEKYPEWLYYHWTKHHLDDFIQTAKSKATTMGHIQRKHLTQAVVRVPNAASMEDIGIQMQPLIDAGKENNQQIQTLTTLRDILLPRLMSGKIKL